MPQLTTNSFGYNFDTESTPKDKALQDAINSKASFHTIMVNPHGDYPNPNDANIVWGFYEALKDTVDDLILMLRFYSVREGNWSTFPDASRWGESLKQLDLPPNTVIDARANEPSLNGSDAATNKAYVKWEIENLKAASEAGHRYAVGAFSTGTPHESLLTSVYGDLWKAVYDYNGAIDMHLYGVFPLEAGETHPYDLMLDVDTTRSLFDASTRWTDYQGWLTGRYFRVETAHDSLGLPMPDMLVAESILDRIGSMPDAINVQWKQKWGMERYQHDNRGILSWERHFKAVFPDLTLSQALEKLLIHARKNIFYKPYIRMALFGHNPQWGYPDGSHKTSGHNVEDDALLDFRASGLARVNTHPMEHDDNDSGEDTTPMEPVWNPDLFDYDVSVTDGYWNLRAAMSASSGVEILGRLTTEPQRMKVSEETKSANNYDWYKFQQGDLTGYFANTDKLVLKRIEAEPPADDTPDDDDDTPEPDTDAIDALQARVDALEGSLQSIVETLEKKVSEEIPVDIPLPHFSSRIPKLMVKPTIQYARFMSVFWGEFADNLENPTHSLQQVAAAGYSTSDKITTPLDEYLAQNEVTSSITEPPDEAEAPTVTDVPDEDCEEAA